MRNLSKAMRFAAYLAKYAAGLPFYPFLSRRSVFRDIHRRGVWRNDETLSGDGSTMPCTERVRLVLPGILEKHSIRSMLDIPCGDFHWMGTLNLDLETFIAADIVPKIVKENKRQYPEIDFRVLDICSDSLPKVDLVFCRDCLVHLSLKDAAAAIENIRNSGVAFLMATTFPETWGNRGTIQGAWRPLNLEKNPFNLTAPIEIVNENFTLRGGRYQDKSMGLWRL
ncbi:MAG: class I SAM-dependent methyltransferase [Kiritimatiellaeota bacterium]|nr:class I SAM-dependent methyltransferase [Kiritimatiellota bacterium]